MLPCRYTQVLTLGSGENTSPCTSPDWTGLLPTRGLRGPQVQRCEQVPPRWVDRGRGVKRGVALGVALGITLLLPRWAIAQSAAENQAASATQSETAQQPAPTNPPATPAKAESSESSSASLAPTGWTAFVQAQSSATSLGTVFSVAADVGYAFTDHIAGDIGLPIIFTRSPFSPVTNHDYYWSGLFGSPYVDVKYTGVFHGVRYTSVLTGTIPLKGEDRIYSTGRFGVDWFNHVEKDMGGVTPFLNFGASNGAVDRFIMPRPYSVARPYQTLGFLGDVEAGASYKRSKGFARGLGIGASYYALVPAGPQKVFSRFVLPYSTLAGDGQHYRYFDSNFLTTNPLQVPNVQALGGPSGTFDGCSAVNNVVSCKGGRSSIARDNGWSVWLDVTRGQPLDVQLGYTRSVHYHLDIYTVMINFDGRSLIRSLMPQ